MVQWPKPIWGCPYTIWSAWDELPLLLAIQFPANADAHREAAAGGWHDSLTPNHQGGRLGRRSGLRPSDWLISRCSGKKKEWTSRHKVSLLLFPAHYPDDPVFILSHYYNCNNEGTRKRASPRDGIHMANISLQFFKIK